MPTRLSYEHASSLSLRPIGALPQPVSLADFTAFAEATGRSLPSCPEETPSLGAPDPIVCVTAADAEAYAAWLGSRLNRKLRLPTADELQHIVLYQVAGLKQRLLVREWTLDCAEGSPSCRERLVIVPAADPLYWPLRLQPRDAEKVIVTSVSGSSSRNERGAARRRRPRCELSSARQDLGPRPLAPAERPCAAASTSPWHSGSLDDGVAEGEAPAGVSPSRPPLPERGREASFAPRARR